MVKNKNHKHKSDKVKQKRKYQRDYLSWGKVFCPALKAEVEFTNLGLLHISQHKCRSLKQQVERYKLLGEAKHIISTASFYQSKRFQNFHDHYAFEAVLNKKIIRVLVRENKKRFYFYSVFFIGDE
jgi:hypothetical protein